MKPWKAILLAILIGVFTGLVAGWLMAMPVFWAIVVVLPITAVAAMALMTLGTAEPSWQPLPPPEESLTVHQATSLSTRLAEGARDPGRFRTRVQPRLRRLAENTLRHKGINLSDEKAREVLGEELYTLITTRDAQLPSPERLAELLSRLEGK
ncbi:hypothetical protein LWC34_38425 [Kibdelosporangium philippinense]|uniref:DUF4129 domain-containing protein n=1 Tax=Kibdelosporangium philippinense TaxID=211113 RepID=A0ABS8ZMA6_9PSEU|nr:hypothetical protein [Kibdelosporangium philippinense]MCE7008649.1 hypothetical protein [Kibdelosporangium philippinense]